MSIALGWLAALLLVAIPLILLLKVGASWRWVGWGILSWVLAVATKTALTALLHALFLDQCPIAFQATVDGVISALTELGFAAWFLCKSELRLPDALAFGAGIGAFELLFTLGVGWLEGFASPPLPVQERLAFVDTLFLVERSLAMVGHTASRLLVYVAVRGRQWLPAAITFTLFTLVDGAASYGILAHWDWADPILMSRFLAWVAAMTIMEAVAAWRYSLRGPAWY